MIVLETQMAELTQKLQTSEMRHNQNDALLRKLMNACEGVLRRGREVPAGAEEAEAGGTEAAAASSLMESVAGEGGSSRSAVLAFGLKIG